MARRSFDVVDVTEILIHWHAGRSISEIAQSLGVDRKTIRRYVAPAVGRGWCRAARRWVRRSGTRKSGSGSPSWRLRRTRCRVQHAAGPPPPLYRHLLVLPVLGTRTPPLARLIAIASVRWRIEEDHQLSEQAVGLDFGQVIRWRSWHRWSALCLLAFMYLAVAAALDRDAHAGLETGLIPVTIPEMLRMLRGTVIPPPRSDPAHRQHWSQWRRLHQYRASQALRHWNCYADATP